MPPLYRPAVYRPAAQGRYPVLYASALHNKDLQGPDIAEVLPPQPAFAPLWFGPLEAGDTRHFTLMDVVGILQRIDDGIETDGRDIELSEARQSGKQRGGEC